MENVVNGRLNRDLNSYRGFVPVNTLLAEGLASPNWGKTFKLLRRDGGTFHGFYVGAGPYISAKTVLNIDKGLTDVLGSTTHVPVPDRTFAIRDASAGQLALAVTGGYRGRIALPGRTGAGGSTREGIYIGANYHYLHGFRYENADIQVRFDTDSGGLLTIRPATAPAVVDYFYSRSGSGFALDFGLAAVIDRWEFGFGANGVANRIEWEEPVGRRYSLQSLVEGGDFIEQRLPGGPVRLRVELPVDYIGSGAYHVGDWSLVSEVSRGFQGTSYRGGLERRFARIELRGGGRYSLERWHPTGGVGLNLSQRVSLDIAAFGTTTNIERQFRPALAVAIRLNRSE